MADKNLVSKSIEIIRNEGISEFSYRARRYILAFLPRYWTRLIKPRHSIKDELRYWINYYRCSSKEVIKEIQGSKMLLDLRDKGIHKDLFLYDVREPECTKIVQKELSEGMKVVDIGANIGYYVLMEARIVGDSGKIYAIEPEPRNFKMLKRNIEMNSCTKGVELLNASVGDKNGETFLSLSDSSNLHRIATPEQIRQNKGNLIKIDMITLDSFLADKDVDLIRMDVEGYEYFILRGMERILSENRPLKLLIEVHTVGIKNRGGDVDTFLEQLANANFRLKYFITEVKESSFISFTRWFKRKGLTLEKSTKYEQPMKVLLEDRSINHLLRSTGGYSLFLER